MEMQHHEFGPSRLEQYRLCPGSYKMQRGMESEAGEAAEEGRLLHERIVTLEFDDLTAEQQRLCGSCLEFIQTIIPKDAEAIYKEERVEIHAPDGKLLTFGTADLLAVLPDRVIGVDWKFGRVRVSSVADNIQMATCAAGAMEKFGRDRCEYHIFQPRCTPSWTSYTFANRGAIVHNIGRIIDAARADTMILRPSEAACRYCLASTVCPAFRARYWDAGALLGRLMDGDDPDVLAALYDDTRVMLPFIKDVEARLRRRIAGSGRCGKYTIRECAGNREIADLNSLFDAVRDIVSPQEFNAFCTLSLGKFEEVLAQKMMALASAEGRKATKSAALAEGLARIDHLISRGSPVSKIVSAEGD